MTDQAAPADAGHPTPSGGQGPTYPGYIPYRHRRPPAEPEDERAEAPPPRARTYGPPPWYLDERWWRLGAVVAVVLLVGIGVAVTSGGGGGGGGGNEGGRSETATATTATDAAAAGQLDGGRPVQQVDEVHAVGEVAHTPNFDVTVLRVVDPYTPTTVYDTADHVGFRLVAVEVEATNTADREVPLSTFAGTELRDAQNRPWDVAIAGVDRPRLDGFVAPGETRRGWIVFEVADHATGLELRLKGNLSATGSLFDLG